MAKKHETQSNNPQGLLAKIFQQKYLLRALLIMTGISAFLTVGCTLTVAVYAARSEKDARIQWLSTGFVFALISVITIVAFVVIHGVRDAAKTVTITRELLSKILSPYVGVLTFQAFFYANFLSMFPLRDPESTSKALIYVARLMTDNGKYFITGLFLTLVYLLGTGLTPFCALRDEVEQERKTNTTPGKKKP